MNGEWIELREEEGYGTYVTDEVFFHGHCKEHELGWQEVSDNIDYHENFDGEMAEEELARLLRTDYGRIQHVYGRKIPSGDGWWRWQWQRHPARGAFKVTRLVEKRTANERRFLRRVRRAAKRSALQRWPMAEIVHIAPAYRERRTKVRMRLEGLRSVVTWHVGDETVTVMRDDVAAWVELYQGRVAS